MNSKVIQFGQLEELLTEPIAPGQVMRVVILETSESLARQIPGWRLVHVGVHVRSINESGHILACHLPVAALELFNGRREHDPTWQRYDAAWEDAAALKERVVTFLQTVAEEKGFTVHTAGVIDLGDIRPLHATWKTDPKLSTKELLDEPK
ncbi:MAG: hypothetical protein IPM53_25170 [Anaerolineaceae bacterium]|nr:hypothetical protein [Anaerolineaceae bacterium]